MRSCKIRLWVASGGTVESVALISQVVGQLRGETQTTALAALQTFFLSVVNESRLKCRSTVT